MTVIPAISGPLRAIGAFLLLTKGRIAAIQKCHNVHSSKVLCDNWLNLEVEMEVLGMNILYFMSHE